MSTMAETMLLTETRTFSKQDLVGIYEEHSPGIYRYSVRLLGDRDLAEDCVSETFSRFLHAVRQGGGPRDNLRAYLYRVAHNWITDHYRRQPQSPLFLEEDEHEDHQSTLQTWLPNQSSAIESDRPSCSCRLSSNRFFTALPGGLVSR
jgi:RNA polymerase sigma-70 factor (ECF subfamily)